jgi:hypothetical protein
VVDTVVVTAILGNRRVAYISSEVYCSRGAPFSISGVAHVCLGWQTWDPAQRSEPSPGYGIPLSVVKMVEPHISKIERCGAPQGIYWLLHLDCRADVGHPPLHSFTTPLWSARSPLADFSAFLRGHRSRPVSYWELPVWFRPSRAC